MSVEFQRSKHSRPPLNLLWTVYALIYDAILILKPYTDTLKRVCDILAKAKAEVVLDAGCGTGNLALYAVRYDVGPVWGVDSSKAMLRVARFKKRLWHESLQNDHFLWADLALAKTLPQRSFDAIASIGVLHAVEDPQQVTKELVKHLKPGGALIVVLPLPVSVGRIIREHLCTAEWWRLVLSVLALPLLAVSLVINLIEERWSEKGHLHFFTAKETKALVEQTGIKVSECSLVFGNAYTLVVGTMPEKDNAF